MVPARKASTRQESDKKIDDILDLGRKSCTLLQGHDPISPDIRPDLEAAIKRVTTLQSNRVSASHLTAFDSVGTDLWNATTHYLRDTKDNEQDANGRRDAPTAVTASLRVYAFYLLDTAYRLSSKRNKDIEQRARNLKVALKTCRSCLEASQLDLAQKVLEQCSDHITAVENNSPLVRLTRGDDKTADLQQMKILASEFYLLRIMHAWKSGRVDVADHLTNKFKIHSGDASALQEKAADLFYEIAKSLLKQNEMSNARGWLERALSSLEAVEVESLSESAADLRLSISAKLVKCFCSSLDHDGMDRAKLIVQQLANDAAVGNRLAVQIMQFDLLLSDPPFRHELVSPCLSRIMHSAVLTKQTFPIIMQCIHRSKRHNPQLACDAMGAFIRDRLLPVCLMRDRSHEPDQTRLETACVTFVVFAVGVNDEAARSTASSVQAVLDGLSQGSSSLLSARAVHAMQTLIWQKISSAADSPATSAWFHLLRHAAFEPAGLTNKARIGRKGITLAIERNDDDAARQAYCTMPPAAQNEPITQYLMFKIALRCNDRNLAHHSLESIVRHTRNDGKFLYACVLEAQESNMRAIAIRAFDALLDKQPAGIHLPTLLRCAARLLAAELDSIEQADEVVDELVKIFEKAAAHVKPLKQASGEHWLGEMQWWSKNAYNLSLKLCGQVHPGHLCRLLATCTTFIDVYLTDESAAQNGAKHRKMLCHFLSASAFIVLARSSDGEEDSLQSYTNCRRQITCFKTMLDSSKASSDLRRRIFELLKYEVECILRLQQWAELNAVLQACLDCKDVDRWDTLADLVLIIHGQSSAIGSEGRDNAQMITLIQRIINETWKKDKDLNKVSRWLRLSFSIDLSDGDGSFAFKLLQQAADMARKRRDDNSAPRYPETELQWLATTASNSAVDLLSAKKYHDSKTWIEGALELARYSQDNGLLHRDLTYKKNIAMGRIAAAERDGCGEAAMMS